ncbi:Inactive protein RESTRICTED TEV MOVEMENT 2 [Spatholobus suberectus]|nr:Inactive protein RESTRICTED TEV MOVEMENT 2 [Spatholobus suberectus]
MDTETGRSRRRVGTTSSSAAPPVAEEIVPNWGWTEDHSGHFLLVDLPEFRKEEVKLQVDGSTGRIIVEGERQTNEQKRVHFELTFPVPADSDMDNISGNFDSEILHVYVPKRTSQEHRESEIEKASNGNVERPQEIESEEPNVVNEERDRAPARQG